MKYIAIRKRNFNIAWDSLVEWEYNWIALKLGCNSWNVEPETCEEMVESKGIEEIVTSRRVSRNVKIRICKWILSSVGHGKVKKKTKEEALIPY